MEAAPTRDGVESGGEKRASRRRQRQTHTHGEKETEGAGKAWLLFLASVCRPPAVKSCQFLASEASRHTEGAVYNRVPDPTSLERRNACELTLAMDVERAQTAHPSDDAVMTVGAPQREPAPDREREAPREREREAPRERGSKAERPVLSERRTDRGGDDSNDRARNSRIERFGRSAGNGATDRDRDRRTGGDDSGRHRDREDAGRPRHADDRGGDDRGRYRDRGDDHERERHVPYALEEAHRSQAGHGFARAPPR